MRHTSPISGITSFGNKYVATAGYDNRVILWDAHKKIPLARGLHDHLANFVTFSPDGKLLASASSDSTIRLWSLPDMKLQKVIANHLDDVEMCAFSPCGKLLATASRDCTVRIIEIQSGEQVTATGHALDVNSVVWNQKGTQVSSSSDDGTIRTWDLNGTCTGIETFDDIQTDTLIMLADESIVVGNDNGEIIHISGGTRKVVQAHNAGIKRLVGGMGRRILSLSYDRSMCVWLLTSEGMTLEVRTEFPEIVWPRSAAFLNENEIVFGTFGDTFAHFDISSAKWETAHVAETHGINAVATDGKSIYTIGDSGVLYEDFVEKKQMGSLCNFLLIAEDVILTGGQMGIVFDARSGEEIYKFRSPLNCAISMKSNGITYAYVGSYTGEVLIFSIVGNKAQLLDVVAVQQNAIKGISIADGFLFTACADNHVKMHQLKDGIPTECLLTGLHDRLCNASCSLGNDTFLSVSRDLTLRIWSKTEQRTIKSPHKNSIKCVSFDPVNQHVCTGTYGGEFGIYDLKKNNWIHLERVSESGISSVVHDSSNQRFLASTYSGKIHEIPATRFTSNQGSISV